MDVLICEDDPVARSVVSDLVEGHGGRVLAAVDSPHHAMAFLERFTPELVIVDVILRNGNGVELIEHVRRTHPDAQVVVFTAHDSLVQIDDAAVEVVVKPDFERLGRIISGSEARAGERRRPVRQVQVFPEAASDRAFYQLVADAQPDDVLVAVRVDRDADEVARSLRGALRNHDVVLQRTDQVVALVIGGGEDTVRALQQRLERTVPAVAARTTSTLAGHDPIDAFTRLTSD